MLRDPPDLSYDEGGQKLQPNGPKGRTKNKPGIRLDLALKRRQGRQLFGGALRAAVHRSAKKA